MRTLMKNALFAAALLPSLASAADLYLGASFGQVEGDESRPGWKLYGGMPIGETFAVELGYLELGNIDTTIAAPDAPYPQTGSGFTLAATAGWPLADNGLSVLGRVGAFFWSESYTLSGIGEVDKDGTDAFYGIGLKMPVSGVDLHLDLERYEVNGDEMTMYSLGVSAPLGW